MKKQCSKLFNEVFDSHCGGCLRTCECGIVHFDSYNHWDWEEGELEKLQQKARKDPEHYVEHDCAVGAMEIAGVLIVCGCSCNLAERFENFIVDHAVRLAEYYNKYSAILKKEALAVEVQESG